MTRASRRASRGSASRPSPASTRSCPLLVRDTARTARSGAPPAARAACSQRASTFPVVPRGEDEIRFQLSADHTPFDVDQALEALASFPGRR